MKFPVFIIIGIASACCTARGQVTIDTLSSWHNNSTVGTFGLPNTATYGQTITAPGGEAYLDSFAFLMDLPASTTFRGYVYAWNGAEATGSALYVSPITSTTGTGYQPVTLNTGGIRITPGMSYVIFASVSGVAGSSGNGIWALFNSDAYAGGEFVFLNNGQDTNQWTSTTWVNDSGDDLAFQASFTPNPVPEPSALILTGLGALGTLIWRRHNRSSQSGPKKRMIVQ
jgi:hypothetical protein